MWRLAEFGHPAAPHVLARTDGFEVVGSDTGGRAAQVINVSTWRDRAVRFFVGPAMGRDCPAFVRTTTKNSVADVESSRPQPALAKVKPTGRDRPVLVYLRPETVMNRLLTRVGRAVLAEADVVNVTHTIGVTAMETSFDCTWRGAGCTQPMRVMTLAHVSDAGWLAALRALTEAAWPADLVRNEFCCSTTALSHVMRRAKAMPLNALSAVWFRTIGGWLRQCNTSICENVTTERMV